MQGAGGYDISASQSTSESATQGFQKSMGDFNIGGGFRLPKYFAYAVLVVVAVLGFMWLKRKI